MKMHCKATVQNSYLTKKPVLENRRKKCLCNRLHGFVDDV